MSTAMILLIIAGVALLFLVFLFNSLVRLKNQVKNSWSQIDVQLKRRADLIPNLIETVKGYAKHEKKVFEEVTKARTSFLNAGSMSEKAQASDMLSGALKSIFAVAEDYPKLRANENFLQLQEELSGTESKIAYARQFYNDTVMRFNTNIQVFPNNLFAKMLGFGEEHLFKADPVDQKPVKVKFE
jgi:LemA protein